MRVMVTGGAGFIGSALCRSLLLDHADELVVVDKLTYAGCMASLAPVSDSPAFHFVRADVADADAMRRAFETWRPDAVVHLAAESHVDRSITSADPFIQTNVVGTYVLLQTALDYWRGLGAAAAEHFRFLHVSTDEVYGSLNAVGQFVETTPYNPRSPYAASKAASDHLASAWHHTYGLPVAISNCSNNYGPCQYPEKLIPIAILNGLEGAPIPVYGDGLQIRDWLHVDDHVRALRLILTEGTPGRCYNVGGGNERTNLAVVETICDALDTLSPSSTIGSRRSLIRHVFDRPGHDRRYAIDASRLENELGWKAQETFETGIRKTVEWYLQNRVWWNPLRAGYDGARLGVPGSQASSAL